MIYKIESIYDLSECDPSHTFNGKNGEISYQTYFKVSLITAISYTTMMKMTFLIISNYGT